VIFSRIKLWLAAAGGVIVAIAWAFLRGWQRAKKDAANEQMRDSQERQQSGREALRDGRDSGAAPDERLRNNDGRW